jgi:hypothetical protein
MRTSLLTTTLSVFLGILLGITTSTVLAWNPPAASPPGGNVSGSPITTGIGQIKSGGLTLNTDSTSIVGLIVGNGGIAVATSSLPVSFAGQGIAVNGKVAAREYCDENGENCVSGGSETLANLSCSTDQIAKYNGSEWVCAEDTGVTMKVGNIGHNKTIPLPAGKNKDDCAITISPWTMYVASDYPWNDNHFGGIRAQFNGDTLKTTCGYYFTYWDDDDKPAEFYAGTCRYLVICN